MINLKLRPLRRKSNGILIIDDEPEIVALLSRLLKKHDHTVYAAGSLQEGWKCLREQRPSILFLDINLPDGNGLQELAQIRNVFPDLRIIMISAYDTTEERSTAKKNGASEFLSKPFNLNQVVNLLQNFNQSAS